MHNPLFFISLPENSIADYPHNTLLSPERKTTRSRINHLMQNQQMSVVDILKLA